MRTAARLRETVSGSARISACGGSASRSTRRFSTARPSSSSSSASLLQLPFLVLQFILKLLCYLFLPIALALFMIRRRRSSRRATCSKRSRCSRGRSASRSPNWSPTTCSRPTRESRHRLRPAPGEIDAASFASLLGGLLAALWLIIGTHRDAVPHAGLICSGSPLAAVADRAATALRAAADRAASMKTLKTGGAAAPALAAGRPRPGGGRSRNPRRPAPMPPPPPPPPPTATTAPRRRRPSGDARAAAVLALAQLPTPQTTI
jgi:hypothetical protein